MTRKLRPCGTKAAYERHRRNNEQPCDPCKAANTAKNHPNGLTALWLGEEEWAAALAKEPPVILWAPNGRGWLVAAHVYDPHGDVA